LASYSSTPAQDLGESISRFPGKVSPGKFFPWKVFPWKVFPWKVFPLESFALEIFALVSFDFFFAGQTGAPGPPKLRNKERS
jgi:hypothetical protein